MDAMSSGDSGKSCCRYLRANTAAGPAIVSDQIGLGAIFEGGTNEVDDRLFRRTHKTRRSHVDLNDV